MVKSVTVQQLHFALARVAKAWQFKSCWFVGRLVWLHGNCSTARL